MPKPTKKQISDLKNEIIMAEKYNDEELKPKMREGIERYSGRFVSHCDDGWDIMLNEIYPVIQNHLPAIFFKTPRAFLKPRNKTYIAKERDPVTGKMRDTVKDSSKSAKTQESIVNYQLVEINYKKETRRVLLDSLLFPHGVLWHGYKGNFGMTQELSINSKKSQVFTKRISPSRFLKDPAVSFEDIDDARWVGRSIDVRLEDLVENDSLNIKSDLKGFVGFGDKIGAIDKRNNGRDSSSVFKRSMIDFADEDFKKSTSSKFGKIYEVFLRPTQKELNSGIPGWILLISMEQEEPLRINEWSIKAEGWPAKVLQFNPVPDSMSGIADIDTYSSIADQKNVITNLQIRNAQQNSKVWVGINKAGADEEDILKVQQGQNTLILFDDNDNPVSQKMFVASAGGQASSEFFALTPVIEKNLQDKSGSTDLARGFLQSGEESATSVRIRAAGSSVRSQYRQDIMADFLRDSVKYIVQLNKQFIPFDKAVRITGSLDIEWSEDPKKEDIQADVDVDLDVISMLPENPEQELARLNQTLGLMIQGLTQPEIRQKLAQEGKTIELSPIIEQILTRQRIRDPKIFRNIKPEETQGFVSVAEIRAAKANVQTALQGNPNVPSPPKEGQDHVARLEVYSSIQNIISQLGDSVAGQIMDRLIQFQQAFLQQEQKQQSAPGVKLDAPSIKTPVGV